MGQFVNFKNFEGQLIILKYLRGWFAIYLEIYWCQFENL